jgi:starvation-inducible DNA-binding protein
MPKKSVKPLETAVANSLAMYMNYKRYHWNTFGPLFRDIHLLFDSHAEPVLSSADDFGERARILGAEAIGSADEVVKHATVKLAHSGMRVKEMIEQAVANHRIIIAEYKNAIKVAGRENDPGTADLFTRIIQVHEKQE